MYSDLSRSEHANKFGHYPLWDKVKFVDRDPHWYVCRVKEAVHIKLHPDHINRESGIEIPEGWMPTIKQHNRYHSGLMREQLLVRTMRIEILQSLTTTARIETHQSQTTTVLLIMRHSQSTSSPDKDQQ